MSLLLELAMRFQLALDSCVPLGHSERERASLSWILPFDRTGQAFASHEIISDGIIEALEWLISKAYQ